MAFFIITLIIGTHGYLLVFSFLIRKRNAVNKFLSCLVQVFPVGCGSGRVKLSF